MPLNDKFDHLKIKLRAIKIATNNFDIKNCIGAGGFGNVYKGEFVESEGRHTTAAVKVLDRRFGQGDLEFWKEIMLLSHYRHTNVASLLGFCDEGKEKILLYKYASRKSLDRYIGGDLTWVRLLKICIGAASGLAYLHNPDGTQQRVLHRDIKSSNILIDEDWKAMISDFGLSKIGPANQENTFLVSQAVGTSGYVDPNYMNGGLLTKESDVYSFGIVLFEVFCGRLCTSYQSSCSFATLARDCYKQGKMKDIIHKNIKDEINPKSMDVFTTIAFQCLAEENDQRPLMTEIVRDLENSLRFQENENVIIEGELVSVKPQELHFQLESMKKISTTMQLKNRTYDPVAYKFQVKSTRPNTYTAQPHVGILLPQSTCQIKFTMQPQKEDPDYDMFCKDKFMVQSAIVSPGFAPKDITRELFEKESGNQVGECKIDVSFVAPKEPLLQPIEDHTEDVHPTTSMSDIRTVNISNSNTSLPDVGTVNSSNSNAVSVENSFNAHFQESSTGELLSIEPHELQFPFELMKKITISLQLKNKTGSPVAFKVRTTKPNKYTADPTTWVLSPNSTKDVSFTMQAQEEAPKDMKCDDKCSLQSAVVSPGFRPKDITRELFKKRSGNQVEECILNVKYISPHQSLSSVREARKVVFSKSANIQQTRDDEDPFHSI